MDSYTTTIIGTSAALLSALAWAYSSILFQKLGYKIPPVGLTFIKSVIGIVYLLIFIIPFAWESINIQDLLCLVLSGIIGISIGDVLFFNALNLLGSRRTVLIGTLGPIVTIFFAVTFLNESLSMLQWIGVGLVFIGVLWVLKERMELDQAVNIKKGVIFAIASIFCMSIGIILTKIGVRHTSAIMALFIRLIAGVIAMTLFGYKIKQLKHWLHPLQETSLLKFLFFAVFIVIFGGFWMFHVALKYIDVSIATILSSTEPLFVLPLIYLLLKEKITFRSVLGGLIAVIGVCLVIV